MADEHLLDRPRKEHTGTTGRTVIEIVADTKYGTHANYTQLEQQGSRASKPASPRTASPTRGAPSLAIGSSTTRRQTVTAALPVRT